MKDINGTEIKVGDYILYAASDKGSSIPDLKYGRVLDVGFSSYDIKIHAVPLYGTAVRKVNIRASNRVVIITGGVIIPANVMAALDKAAP